MLKNLYIKNYVLIQELHFSPEEGLNVITGETGAGKSILVGALGLVLGNRADFKAVRTGEKKCIVEATFDLEQDRLKDFFEEHELDYEPELILRREILSSGKSRSFVNDSPVSLSILNALSFHIVDIHSQHEHLLLKSKDFLFSWLDSMANAQKEAEHFAMKFKEYKRKSNELNELRNAQRSSEAELDFWHYQFSELEPFNLESKNFQDLEEEYDLLQNAEELQQQSYQAYERLAESEGSALDAIRTSIKEIGNLAQTGDWKKVLDGLNNAEEELSEASTLIRRLAEGVTPDEARLSEIEETISALNQLMQKHHCSDVEALARKRDDLASHIENHQQSTDTFEQLEKEVDLLKSDLEKLGLELHELRHKAQKELELKVSEEMAKLGLPNAEVALDLSIKDSWSQHGSTEFKLLFSPNRGMPLAEAGKTASGGEISRLMLVLKAQLAQHVGLPTLIFDEIDTGVSGEIGQKMGTILRSLGNKKQVICITHLPQIAAVGQQHYFVYKEEAGTATSSAIRKLTTEERVQEIAKMLSGEIPTEGAVTNAKELLSV